MMAAGQILEAAELLYAAGGHFSAPAGPAITGSTSDAVKFGNLVASIAIAKRGAWVASPAEALDAATE
jgi:hypothetical protein